jgi:hypothetical protein
VGLNIRPGSGSGCISRSSASGRDPDFGLPIGNAEPFIRD